MRTLYLFMMTSLDGFFEGEDHSIEWHMVDEEFNQFAAEQLAGTGTIVFGRVTYEGMAEYWPTEAAIRDDPEVARAMNSADKVVVSNSMTSPGWANTTLITGDVAAGVGALKARPGNDIAIFGSNDLATNLLRMGLLDEVRLMVCPLLLGSGTHLFEGLEAPARMDLIESRQFGNGNVLLRYRVVHGP